MGRRRLIWMKVRRAVRLGKCDLIGGIFPSSFEEKVKDAVNTSPPPPPPPQIGSSSRQKESEK
jgi:hypothetical protein